MSFLSCDAALAMRIPDPTRLAGVRGGSSGYLRSARRDRRLSRADAPLEVPGEVADKRFAPEALSARAPQYPEEPGPFHPAHGLAAESWITVRYLMSETGGTDWATTTPGGGTQLDD